MRRNPKRMSNPWLALGLAVAMLAVAGAGATEAPADAQVESAPDAEETLAAQIKTKAREEYLPVQFHGVQVHIDPETGRLRTPTPEEAAELANAMQRLMSPTISRIVEPVVQGDGTVMMEVDPSLFSYSIAHRHDDGTLATNCVHGADAAVSTEAVAPTTPEEK